MGIRPRGLRLPWRNQFERCAPIPQPSGTTGFPIARHGDFPRLGMAGRQAFLFWHALCFRCSAQPLADHLHEGRRQTSDNPDQYDQTTSNDIASHRPCGGSLLRNPTHANDRLRSGRGTTRASRRGGRTRCRGSRRGRGCTTGSNDRTTARRSGKLFRKRRCRRFGRWSLDIQSGRRSGTWS